MQPIIYFGDRKIVLEAVKKDLQKQAGEKSWQSSLFFEVEKMQIAVDDIRRVKDFCYKTSEGARYVFLSSFFWSEEVQNAMLKILEEPPTDTRIYLFGLSAKYFLPTVLSRVQKMNYYLADGLKMNRYLDEAREVLLLEPNDRIENKIMKKILGLKVVDFNYEKNLESEKKDRESQVLFLWALIEVLLDNRQILDKNLLQKINQIVQFADIEGSNPTLFIEWLLLSSPRVMV